MVTAQGASGQRQRKWLIFDAILSQTKQAKLALHALRPCNGIRTSTQTYRLTTCSTKRSTMPHRPQKSREKART
eukprot:2953738-Pleurochrysis_carterae.AAC.5